MTKTTGSTWASRMGVALVPAAIALAAGAIAGDKSLAPGAVTMAPSATATSAPAGALQQADIEAIVRNYLIKNPEVLMEAKLAYDQKVEEQQMAAMTKSIGQNAQSLFRDGNAPLAGDPKGDVTVVEFFDYNCGYCRTAMPQVSQLINSDKKVRFVFKEFPIFGDDSEAAARVAIAAKQQDKYWEVHQALFERKGADHLDEAISLQIASGLGLDMDKLKADMASEETTKEIMDVRALADRMGIQGTPHFIIGEAVIPGAPQNLLELLNEKIASVRKTGCSVC